MADTGHYLQIGGLYYLGAGTKVSVAIGGIDCGDYVIDSTYQIYVPFASDADGITTSAYVASLSPYTGEQAATVTYDAGLGGGTYTIPLVVGPGYTSQAQLSRPISADDLKNPQGPEVGNQRRAHQFAALVNDCISNSIGFGTTFDAPSNVNPVELLSVVSDPGSAVAADTFFSDVIWGALDDQSGFSSQLAWQVDRPSPATVAAVTTFIEDQER